MMPNWKSLRGRHEEEIWHLQGRIDSLQRQQEDICGDMTLIEYDEYHRNQISRLRDVCNRVVTVLETAYKSFKKVMLNEKALMTRPMWPVGHTLLHAIYMLKRKTNYGHYVPPLDDGDNAEFDGALSQARSIAGVQE